MPYFGVTTVGPSRTTLTGRTLRATRHTLAEAGRIGYISAAVDGLNATRTTPSRVRAVVYDAALRLVDYSEAITLAGGEEVEWREFPMLRLPRLAPGDYYLGMQGDSGDTAQVAYANVAGSPPVVTSVMTPATYGSTPPATINAASQTYVIGTFGHYQTAELPDASDEWYASLGWHSSQEALGATTVEPGSALQVTCGWHGTNFHPGQGAFAIVNSDGPLADRVGERLRVTYGGREAFVYCHDEADIEEDISLSKQAFARLALLSTEELSVIVETMT